MTEFAVIETGGKQYQVKTGDVITIEKLVPAAGPKGEPKEYKEGDKIVFDKVLLVDDGENTTIGMPYISEAKVLGTFQAAGRAKKVTVIKYKQKSRYFKKNGHRQPFVKVKIDKIK